MRPVTVGVFGSWGTGKSTLLNLIERGLNPPQGASEFIVVRFDAWLYQGFDDSRAALMEVIASSLIDAAEKTSFLPGAKKLYARANKMRMLGLLVEGGALALGMPAFGFGAKGVEALGKLFSGEVDQDSLGTLKDEGGKAKDSFTGLLGPENQQTPPKQAFRKEFFQMSSSVSTKRWLFLSTT